VAKEYVASRTRDDGALIISRLAGAAEDMEEALAVNPYDLEDVSDALHRAAEMTLKEKTERMRALRRRVLTRDIHWWLREFLGAAGHSIPRGALRRIRTRSSASALEPASWIQSVGATVAREPD